MDARSSPSLSLSLALRWSKGSPSKTLNGPHPPHPPPPSLSVSLSLATPTQQDRRFHARRHPCHHHRHILLLLPRLHPPPTPPPPQPSLYTSPSRRPSLSARGVQCFEARPLLDDFHQHASWLRPTGNSACLSLPLQSRWRAVQQGLGVLIVYPARPLDHAVTPPNTACHIARRIHPAPLASSSASRLFFFFLSRIDSSAPDSLITCAPHQHRSFPPFPPPPTASPKWAPSAASPR